MKLPTDLEPIFKKQATLSLATADQKGKPNSSYVRFWWIQGDKIVLINNFMNKTRANMEKTGWASVSAYDMEAHKAYQVKGKVEFKTTGPEYEQGKKMDQNFYEQSGMMLPPKKQ